MRNALSLLFAVLLNCSAALAADDAEQAFQSLFGARLKQVQATAGPGDDVELAKAMLAAAKDVADVPTLVLLCDHIVALGQKAPDGYAAAAEALRMLIERAPASKEKSLETLANLLTRQLSAAKPADKAAVGEDLVAALMSLGQLKLDAGAHAEAAAAYQRAVLAATSAKSSRLGEAKSAADFARGLQQAHAKLAQLQERLLKSATDADTALAIVRIYVVDLDKPADARPFLDRVKDATWLAAVPLAVKEGGTLTEQEAMVIADFYAARGKDAPAIARAAMLEKAKRHYERFLALHPGKDLSRAKAELALKDIEAALKLASPAGLPSTVAGKDEVDCLRLIDVRKNVLDGKVTVERGGLMLKAGSPGWARVAAPVEMSGAYEVQLAFARVAGNDDFTVALPAGGRHVLLVIDGWGGGRTALHRGGEDLIVGSTAQLLANGRRYTLQIAVTPDDSQQQVEIQAKLDGKPIIKWSGPATSLGVPGTDQMGHPGNIGLRTSSCSHVIHEFKVKAITGTVQRTENLAITHRAGSPGGGPFRHLGPPGSFLVGLVATTGEYVGNTVIRSVKPIYLQDGKKVEGPRCGLDGAGAIEVMAKDGYAIGAIRSLTGQRYDGFEVTFMKIKGDRLDPKASYKSQWVGGKSGNEAIFDGKGDPVVGIHGGAGADFDGLGVIFRR